jgi:hypothetical protein
MKQYKAHVELEHNKGTRIKQVYLAQDVQKKMEEMMAYFDALLFTQEEVMQYEYEDERDNIAKEHNDKINSHRDKFKEVFIK